MLLRVTTKMLLRVPTKKSMIHQLLRRKIPMKERPMMLLRVPTKKSMIHQLLRRKIPMQVWKSQQQSIFERIKSQDTSTWSPVTCYEIGLRAGLNPSPDHFDNIRCDFEAIEQVSLLETAAALEEKAAVELHIVYRGLQPGNRGVRIHYKLGVWDVHSFNTTLDKLHTFNETHLLEDVCDEGAMRALQSFDGCPSPTDNFLTSLTVDKINKDDAPEDGGDLNVPAQLDAEHRVSGFAGEVGLENALSTTDEPEKSTKIVEDVNEIGFNPARMGAVQSASLGFILQTLLVGFAIIRATSTVL